MPLVPEACPTRPERSRMGGSENPSSLQFKIKNSKLPIASPFLARSFFRIQGLGSAESGAVLEYCEHFGPARKRSSREKKPPK